MLRRKESVAWLNDLLDNIKESNKHFYTSVMSGYIKEIS